MSARTYADLVASIDALDMSDQARLLQHLAPRVVDRVLARTPTASSSAASAAGTSNPTRSDAAAAVAGYRAVGDRLAATSVAGAPSLVDALTRQRR
ncbi:MAG TPA: hypothetical protein VF796_19210 [Humisphaera sp.]